MKKVAGIVCVVLACLGLIGCNMTEGQLKLVANTSGMAASITWIAYDDPSAEAKLFVSKTLDVINVNASAVQNGTNYTDVIFPFVEKYVSESNEIPDRYKSLCLAGSSAILNALDLFVESNPDIKNKQQLVLSVVNSFVNGAQAGLALSNDDPRIVRATKTCERRQKIFKQ
jgi:hypothetical protein